MKHFDNFWTDFDPISARHRYPRRRFLKILCIRATFCQRETPADLEMNGTPRDCAINRTSNSMSLNIDSRRRGVRLLSTTKLLAKWMFFWRLAAVNALRCKTKVVNQVTLLDTCTFFRFCPTAVRAEEVTEKSFYQTHSKLQLIFIWRLPSEDLACWDPFKISATVWKPQLKNSSRSFHVKYCNTWHYHLKVTLHVVTELGLITVRSCVTEAVLRPGSINQPLPQKKKAPHSKTSQQQWRLTGAALLHHQMVRWWSLKSSTWPISLISNSYFFPYKRNLFSKIRYFCYQ